MRNAECGVRNAECGVREKAEGGDLKPEGRIFVVRFAVSLDDEAYDKAHDRDGRAILGLP
jgi:hypothetical protein